MRVYKDGFELHRVLKKDIQTKMDLLPPSDMTKTKVIFDVYIMGLPRDIEKFKKLIEQI